MKDKGEANRADWIRTSDLLNPIQAHYQAVLRPDVRRTIRRAALRLPNFFRRSAVPAAEEGVDQLRELVAVAALEDGAGRDVRSRATIGRIARSLPARASSA